MPKNTIALSSSSHPNITDFFKGRGPAGIRQLKEDYESDLNTLVNTLHTIVSSFAKHSKTIEKYNKKEILAQIQNIQRSADELNKRLEQAKQINERLLQHVSELNSSADLIHSKKQLFENNKKIQHDIAWLSSTALLRNNLLTHVNTMFILMEMDQTSLTLQEPRMRVELCQYLTTNTNCIKQQLSSPTIHPTPATTESWAEEVSQHFL